MIRASSSVIPKPISLKFADHNCPLSVLNVNSKFEISNGKLLVIETLITPSLIVNESIDSNKTKSSIVKTSC